MCFNPLIIQSNQSIPSSETFIPFPIKSPLQSRLIASFLSFSPCSHNTEKLRQKEYSAVVALSRRTQATVRNNSTVKQRSFRWPFAVRWMEKTRYGKIRNLPRVSTIFVYHSPPVDTFLSGNSRLVVALDYVNFSNNIFTSIPALVIRQLTEGWSPEKLQTVNSKYFLLRLNVFFPIKCPLIPLQQQSKDQLARRNLCNFSSTFSSLPRRVPGNNYSIRWGPF